MTENWIHKPTSLMVTTRMDTVEPEPIRWLWPSRIELGKVTLIAGDPGLGKSMLTTTIAAHVRDADIRELAEGIVGSPWAKAGCLAGWCSEYKNRLQPVMRFRSLSPEDSSAVNIPPPVISKLTAAASHGEDAASITNAGLSHPHRYTARLLILVTHITGVLLVPMLLV